MRSVIAFLLIMAVAAVAVPNMGLRGTAIYYNDMNGATVIQFRQTTAETVTLKSNSWMIRNPSTTVSLVLLTGSSTTTGITIPPGAVLSGNDFRDRVKLYSASSTPVELYVESEE